MVFEIKRDFNENGYTILKSDRINSKDYIEPVPGIFCQKVS